MKFHDDNTNTIRLLKARLFPPSSKHCQICDKWTYSEKMDVQDDEVSCQKCGLDSRFSNNIMVNKMKSLTL